LSQRPFCDLWVDGFVQGLSDDDAIVGGWLKRSTGLKRARREQLDLPVGLFLKSAVLVMSVPLIMLQWGYSAPLGLCKMTLIYSFHTTHSNISAMRSAADAPTTSPLRAASVISAFTYRQLGRRRCWAGKWRINSRTSASVLSCVTPDMVSGRNSLRDQSGRSVRFLSIVSAATFMEANRDKR
jgi:hypothetical protein